MTKMLLSILLVTLFLSCHGESFEHNKKDKIKCDCLEAKACKAWSKAVAFGKYLDLPICGFHNISLNPLLCCPREDVSWKKTLRRSTREIQSLEGLNNLQLSCKITSGQSSPIKKAKQKCAEYGKSIFQNLFEVSIGDGPYQKEKVDTCVRSEGDELEPKSREFPHMALIGYEKEDEWLCAGSLISERFILSVAHCANTPRGPAKWAKLGDLDTSTDDDIARPQIFKITERIVHPEYKAPKMDNDIALFKLEKDIEFTIYMRPACLYTRRDPPDSVADATGWGGSEFGESRSSLLKKIKMQLLAKDECIESYNSTYPAVFDRNYNNGIDYDTMICSKESNAQGKKMCKGDSGGPLQVRLKDPYCMYGLIGLTSFGPACKYNFPGINTRVSHYIPWIVENVWPEED